jgi:hypothetical protein
MKRSAGALAAVAFLVSFFSLLLWGDTRPSASGTGAASSLPVEHTAFGDVIRLLLASAPFPHPDRADGYTYDQVKYPADPHYNDSSVAVFVPQGFHATGPVNLVFFFHGWDSSIDDAQQRFDLHRQFSESGTQALLVLPELAWNAPDSFGGKLEDRGGFTRMVGELLGILSANGITDSAQPGTISLAWHSGAFQVIAIILANGDLAANIREVYLFDAVYARIHQFATWIETRGGRFVSVISAGGEETTVVDDLIALLRADHVPVATAYDTLANDGWALAERVVFLQSSSDHYGVVADHDEFRRILGARQAHGN